MATSTPSLRARHEGIPGGPRVPPQNGGAIGTATLVRALTRCPRLDRIQPENLSLAHEGLRVPGLGS